MLRQGGACARGRGGGGEQELHAIQRKPKNVVERHKTPKSYPCWPQWGATMIQLEPKATGHCCWCNSFHTAALKEGVYISGAYSLPMQAFPAQWNFVWLWEIDLFLCPSIFLKIWSVVMGLSALLRLFLSTCPSSLDLVDVLHMGGQGVPVCVTPRHFK